MRSELWSLVHREAWELGGWGWQEDSMDRELALNGGEGKAGRRGMRMSAGAEKFADGEGGKILLDGILSLGSISSVQRSVRPPWN